MAFFISHNFHVMRLVCIAYNNVWKAFVVEERKRTDWMDDMSS